MKIGHALWICVVLGCGPGPTIQLGSWPGDGGQDDAGEIDFAADGGEPGQSEADGEAEEHSTEDPDPEELVPCSRQAECAGIERWSHCQVELGYCVECLVHSDCEPGKYCQSNVCLDD